MKLTRGEFCQFNIATRFELLKEFGKSILQRKVRMKIISVYKVFDFYVEVYENVANRRVERIEPLKSISILQAYQDL